METKQTDKEALVNGLKTMVISIILMFLSPSIIYIAFSNQEKVLYIPLLVLGLLGCSVAIYLVFKGLNTILDSMFKSKKNN